MIYGLVPAFLIAANLAVALLALDSLRGGLFWPGVAFALALSLWRFRLPALAALRPARGRESLLLGLTLLLALGARLPWSPHQIAGQDQGYYALMAQTYMRQGRVDLHDDLRARLSPATRALYDETKPLLHSLAPVKNPDGSAYEVALYPLFPALMGFFSQLVGNTNQGLFHVFCGSASVLALFFLGRALGLSFAGSLLGSAFLALSPLQAWVSKLPFTESQALLMLLLGYLFLTLWARSLFRPEDERADYACGLCSLLAFNAFFYTRISFALHLPFLTLLGIALLVYLPPRRRVAWALYLAALTALLVLSAIFYYAKLPNLAEGAFDGVLLRLSSARPTAVKILIGLAAAGVLLSAGLSSSPRLSAWARARIEGLRRGVPFFLPVAFALVLIGGISLASRGLQDPSRFWLEDPAFAVFSRSVFYRVFLWLSPFGFLALLLGPFRAERPLGESTPLLGLFVFTAVMLLVFAQVRYVLYSFYADRYFTSELLPALFLCLGAVVSLARGPWVRRLAWAGLLCQALALLPQLGRAEGNERGFFEALHEKLPVGSVLFFRTQDGLLFLRLIPPLAYGDDRFRGFPLHRIEILAEPALREELCREPTRSFLLSDLPPERLPEFARRDPGQTLSLKLAFLVNGPHGWIPQLPQPAPTWARWLPPLQWVERQTDFRLAELDFGCPAL